MRDFEGFCSCIKEVLKPQLDLLGFDFSDIGLIPTEHFIEIPGTHWFFVVIWVKRRVDNQTYEISHKLGGDIGEMTDREDVEELCTRILQKLKEAITCH